MSGRVLENTGRPLSFSHAHSRNKKSHTRRPQAAPNIKMFGQYRPAKTVRKQIKRISGTERSGVLSGDTAGDRAAGQADAVWREGYLYLQHFAQLSAISGEYGEYVHDQSEWGSPYPNQRQSH
jgi:hypothetical protein